MIVTIIGMLAVPVGAATLDSRAGVVSVSSGRLNVRASATTASPIVSGLNKGSYITLISKSGSWWYVEYGDGRFGYCHADYIKEVSDDTASVSVRSGTLNVRSGAGTSYSRIGSLAKGEAVIVLSESGGWSRVLFDGTRTGYVSNTYLSGNAGTQNTSYSKISLKVPDYKQTDPRWAYVTLGSSGKTIYSIGCATTGIAMMESYRTGTTIYPDAMSKKLNYTSSGSVYWPSNFVVTTSSADYLSKIYNLLKQGKPVLLGAKTSYGGQHWVVITGYTGGDTLSASNFTINDPASSSRVNLSQFFSAYPIFYKYFYYK